MSKDFDVHLPPFIVEESIPFAMSEDRPRSWGVGYLQAAEVWEKSRGEKAVVFVIDTEDDSGHEALQNNLIDDYCKRFTNEADSIISLGGHGLHVADTIVQVAPSVKIGLLKALTNEGSGYTNWIGGAIRWAADLELLPDHRGYAKIINMSLGSETASGVMKSAIDYARAKGVSFCCASGNDGKDVDYPGAYKDSVITIGAIDEAERPASFSSPGVEVDLAAPGVRVYAAYKSGYAALSGTSMATPHVSGCCALLLSNGVGEIQNYLKAGATDINTEGFDHKTGFGAPILPAYFQDKPTDPEPEPDEKPIPALAYWLSGGLVVGIILYFLLS